MLFDGVLIASDFDGTLVPSTGMITEGVRRAIRFFIENGGRFTVCTGRVYLGFHRYDPEIINAPVILANGGMLYDYAQKQIVADRGIGPEGIEPVRAIRDLLPELSIEMYSFDRAYAIHCTDRSHRHFTSMDIPFAQVEDPAQAPQPWAKLMLAGAQSSIAKAEAYLAAHAPQLNFLHTDGEFLEVLSSGVDKGTALLALADHLGVRHEDVYAVGDGYNDVEMLRAAAIGFVPANGDVYAKRAAGCIVPSNEEDAVAHVIEHLRQHYIQIQN